jgi:hypothetical protein
MTNLQAIKQRVNYPLSDIQAEEKLISRGVDAEGTFSKEVAKSREFRLAYADTLRFVLTMVNLSQGGSITAQNPAGIRGTANAIYKEYGEPLIGESGEQQNVISDATDMW